MNPKNPTRRALLATSGSTIAATIAGCLGGGTDEWELDRTLPATTATVYQGPSCDCCDVYVEYLEEHLDSEPDVLVTEDLTAVKDDRGIAPNLRSCHTVEIGGYVVEGHVPVTVIETLLDDEPSIDGIALPGMPAGSPGMGGSKDEPWTVYEIRSGTDPAVYTEL